MKAKSEWELIFGGNRYRSKSPFPRPQCSSLSPILFSIMLSDPQLFQHLNFDTKRKTFSSSQPRPYFQSSMLTLTQPPLSFTTRWVGGSLGSNDGWGSALVLFLFFVNVSGMLLKSRLSFQPFTIPAPWVFLHVRWSIPLFHSSTLGGCLQFPRWKLGG